MTNINFLTADGLLYEGSDFEEWLERLRLVFKVRYPGSSIHFRACPHNDQFGKYKVDILHRGGLPPGAAANTIWCRVSPHIRSRIVDTDLDDPTTLLNALHTAARPFRIMDLPAELRLRIYWLANAIDMPFGYKEVDLQYKKYVMPRLAHASRQLRIELLPIFYEQSSFQIRYHFILPSPLPNPPKPLVSTADIADGMKDWISMIGSTNAKLLRKVWIQFAPDKIRECDSSWWRPGQDVLYLELVRVDGKFEIQVAEHAWMKPSSQSRLKAHAAAISKMAQSLNLQGEALVMFFTSRPDAWEQLEFIK